jgi:protein-L-isoaspartate(D-aspartate) O-methyltransferase
LVKAVTEFAGQREKMVRTQMEQRGVKDPRVLDAFRKIPRHLFMPEGIRHRAHDDAPLPIGGGQTISQPYTVARMTEALELTGKEVALEIGTGSGYQTAILSELAEWVYTVERIRDLASRARALLDELGCNNVAARIGDGTFGWKEHSPYQCIIVTAGAPEIPRPLVEQLEEGGRIVIPVGDQHTQRMIVGVKSGGELKTRDVGAYRFVELIGTQGWKN